MDVMLQTCGDARQVLATWPADRPLVLLHSGRFDARWSCRSLVGLPTGHVRLTSAGWRQQAAGPEPFNVPAIASASDPLDGWRSLLAMPGRWFGYVSYDLGRWLEHWPRRLALDERWPLVELAYCPCWLEQDLATGCWSSHGVAGDTKSCPWSWRDSFLAGDLDAEALVSDVSPSAYRQAVQRVKDYIAAGDVYQVNLSQRFTTTLTGEQAARRIADRLLGASPAWYGAYIELPDWNRGSRGWQAERALASVSPELFLQMDAQGQIITRPIKGTRPATCSVSELRQSLKDQAELHMIVDLLRNDLGRVCRTGSVQVLESRRIETHPTVHHGVATIAGQLAAERDWVDLLQATLPGGSVTGAPKIRAMQIIDELEPVSRGPYCGAIGWMQGRQGMLNVAIRTLCLTRRASDRWQASFHVGGGIVADSDPAQEYQETLDKAAAIRQALEMG